MWRCLNLGRIIKHIHTKRISKALPRFTFTNTYMEETKSAKKDLSHPIEGSYEPSVVESGWTEWWVKSKCFHAVNSEEKGEEKVEEKGEKLGRARCIRLDKSYTIVIPLPNVTGSLHIGHCLFVATQDALIRYKRMKGFNTLWIPGTDHAGISTQTAVEKSIMRSEGKTRHDLGREAFIERVWDWKEEYGGRIISQLSRMGSSLDLDRTFFTLDPPRYEAVMEGFCRLYEKGIIYRDNRLVNWCCHLQTALSDIEVEHIEVTKPTRLKVPGYENEILVGVMTDFAYKFKDSEEEIIIATTRPETMLGDTAVAVHPDDPRYQHLIGRELVHPFIPERKMKIIADPILVDMKFGTGAVKVTPGHDPNDFLCGKRNHLQFVNILTNAGMMNSNAGPMFEGMKRFDARGKVIQELTKMNLLRGKRDHPMSIGRCERTNDLIEPVIKPQWWVGCEEMAKRAVNVVKNEELKILPPHYKQTWYSWLENIRDWCISRQLWWGHRIPAYLCTVKDIIPLPDEANPQHWVCGRSENEAMQNAVKKFKTTPENITLSQDPDVLDTWFSSGIIPFSSLFWPNTEHPDYKEFFPTDVLETGHDILFFWVARMVMMSLTLTDKLPFHTVYLHMLIRDPHGAKMSKIKGNVIDPLEVINSCTLQTLLQKLDESVLTEKEIKKGKEDKTKEFPNGIPECGSDALRFGMLAYMNQGRSINMNINRIIGYRHFCNKLWNALKFGLLHLPVDFKPIEDISGLFPKMLFHEKWILHRLYRAIEQVNECFNEFKFGEMIKWIYDFWLYEYCDIYLEAIKPYLYSGEEHKEDKETEVDKEHKEHKEHKEDEEDGERLMVIRNIIYLCLCEGLKLTHPSLPFLTEELYQRLPGHKDYPSISIAQYPEKEHLEPIMGQPSHICDKLGTGMESIMKIVHSIRSLSSTLNIPTKFRPQIFLLAQQKELPLLEENKLLISTLSKGGQCLISSHQLDETINQCCVMSPVYPGVDLYLKVKDLIDIQLEIKRIEKKIGELEKKIKGIETKMKKEGYEEKVPQDIRDGNKERHTNYSAELTTLSLCVQKLKLMTK